VCKNLEVQHPLGAEIWLSEKSALGWVQFDLQISVITGPEHGTWLRSTVQLGMSTKQDFQVIYSSRDRSAGKQHEPLYSRHHRLERSGDTFSKQKRVRLQYSYKSVGHAENVWS